MSYLPNIAARTFTTHGVVFNSFASSATGAQRLGVWRADFSPQTPGLAHTMTEEEVLHVLEGELDNEIAEQAFTAGAGDAVLVPAGAQFRVSNSSDLPARAWVVTTLGMNAEMLSGEELSPPWAQ